MLSVCSTDEFSSSLLSDDDADHKATVGPKLLSYPFLEHRSQPPFWTLELVLYSGHLDMRSLSRFWNLETSAPSSNRNS